MVFDALPVMPEVLLKAYARGAFPMAKSHDDVNIDWFTLRIRGIIPLEMFRVSSKVKKLARQPQFKVHINKDIRSVIENCADREVTWISNRIKESYIGLYYEGHAHSVEVYQYDKLVGGLYGATLGGAFFAESMFQTVKDASKIALYHCHQILVKQGFELWDVQIRTDHLSQFGCIEITDKEYNALLSKAIKKKAFFKKTGNW